MDIVNKSKKTELRKQLYRFNRAKTLKTLHDSLKNINVLREHVNNNSLNSKERCIIRVIDLTYRVRSKERWYYLLEKRKIGKMSC